LKGLMTAMTIFMRLAPLPLSGQRIAGTAAALEWKKQLSCQVHARGLSHAAAKTLTAIARAALAALQHGIA
jgi:hypothetical protein